jgi:hypothetical protein
MKKIIIKCVIFLFPILLMSCDSDNADIPESEEKAKELAATWVINPGTAVLRDDIDVTADYGEFSIFFTEQFGYFIQGDPNNVLHPEGIWSFNGTNYSEILLNGDERPITASLNGDVLTFSFENSENTPIGGRVRGITGSYKFTLVKQ